MSLKLSKYELKGTSNKREKHHIEKKVLNWRIVWPDFGQGFGN